LIRIFRAILIIADDFTGANDTVAQFAKIGLRALTTFNPNILSKYLDEYRAVAISTESRADPPPIAYRKLYEIGMKIKDFNDILLYKKIDSTLRGNITEEIKGLFDSLKPDLIVFAPAYPKQGRVTINGIHYVNKIPVDQTFFAKDPRSPVKTSVIPKYFEDVFRDQYTHIYLDELRTGSFIEKAGKYKVLSFDVENDNDLRTIAETLIKYGGRVVWVGSAGLAEAISSVAIVGKTLGKPMILVIGTLNDVTRRQVSGFIKEFATRLIKVNVRKLLNNFDEEYNRILEQVEDALKMEVDIIITSSYEPDQVNEGYLLASEMNLTLNELGKIIADKLGKAVAMLIERCGASRFGGIFASGGDIAMALFKSLGIDRVEVIGEVEPGVPLLKHDGICIVTKAGGFGNDQTIIKTVVRIKGESKCVA